MTKAAAKTPPEKQTPDPQAPDPATPAVGAQGQDQGGDNGEGDEDDDPDQKAGPPAPALPPVATGRRTAALAALAIVPEAKGKTDHAGARELLFRACEIFGIDPSLEARPGDLLAWRYETGDERDGVPNAVILVTRGGQKLKWWDDDTYPLDPDTDERLANILNAWTLDPATKIKVRRELPADLTLPRWAVTGKTTSTEHRYEGGYLKSGGAKEAARRAAPRK